MLKALVFGIFLCHNHITFVSNMEVWQMYPEWVLAHKKKGTNISCIGGRYYLYSVGSKWNKEKGRAQKITKEYLGRITEGGLIPPKRHATKEPVSISVKEYGATNVLMELGADVLSRLKEVFPHEADRIFTIAALRVLERCPFKRLEHFYNNSFLSEAFSRLSLSGSGLSAFLKEFGGNREKIVEFMKSFIGEGGHVFFDGTNLISNSEKMPICRNGYNPHGGFDPQVNLLYAFSHESRQPAYYRIVPGNIRDISSFKLSVAEAGLKNVVIVADKGFGSDANFKMLDAAQVQYIVPLKRNSTLFDPAKLETGSKASFDGYFMFNGRPVWHYSHGATVVFLDEDLKNREQKMYLQNIGNKTDGYTMGAFLEKQFKFGSIVIKTNVAKSPEEIYCLYKERGQIEQSFDFLKNLLEQDKSYMQNEKCLEAWAFINHVSLLLNYKVYNRLRDKNQLAKFSVADFLSHLKSIFKVKVNNSWSLSETTKKTRQLLDCLDLHIT